MTNQQVVPEALHLATASNAMADEGEMIHLLSWHEIRNLLRANAAELRRQHAECEALRVERERNLNSIRVCNEIINKKNAELESLTTGYAAARLEIESLQARIKTMTKEHADELTVAHLDGRMRAAQPAPQQEAVAWLNPWRADQVTTDYDAYGEHGIPLVYQQPAPATQQASQQEPVAWYVTGCGRLLDEDEAKAEARHIGGSARAIPLYTAPQADSQPASVADYTPLPDFDTIEQHIYGACRRYITQDMLEPIHNLIRDALDADRAARAPAGQPLFKFYGVTTDADLIAAQARHIERLQAKLPQTPSFAPQQVREG